MSPPTTQTTLVYYTSPPTTINSFTNLLTNPLYSKGLQILHFSGHSTTEYLQVETRDSQTRNITNDEISGILNLRKQVQQLTKTDDDAAEPLKIVFLCSCQSNNIAQNFVRAGIPHVISINNKINLLDRVASLLTQTFYSNLFSGKSVRASFDNAKTVAMGIMIEEYEIRCEDFGCEEKSFIVLQGDGNHDDILFDIPSSNNNKNDSPSSAAPISHEFKLVDLPFNQHRNRLPNQIPEVPFPDNIINRHLIHKIYKKITQLIQFTIPANSSSSNNNNNNSSTPNSRTASSDSHTPEVLQLHHDISDPLLTLKLVSSNSSVSNSSNSAEQANRSNGVHLSRCISLVGKGGIGKSCIAMFLARWIFERWEVVSSGGSENTTTSNGGSESPSSSISGSSSPSSQYSQSSQPSNNSSLTGGVFFLDLLSPITRSFRNLTILIKNAINPQAQSIAEAIASQGGGCCLLFLEGGDYWVTGNGDEDKDDPGDFSGSTKKLLQPTAFRLDLALSEILRSNPLLIIFATSRYGVLSYNNSSSNNGGGASTSSTTLGHSSSFSASNWATHRSIDRRSLLHNEVLFQIPSITNIKSAHLLCKACPREFYKRELYGGLLVGNTTGSYQNQSASSDGKDSAFSSNTDGGGIDLMKVFSSSNIISSLHGHLSTIIEVGGLLGSVTSSDNHTLDLVDDEDRILRNLIPKAKSKVRCCAIWRKVSPQFQQTTEEYNLAAAMGYSDALWSDVAHWLGWDFDEFKGHGNNVKGRGLAESGGVLYLGKKFGVLPQRADPHDMNSFNLLRITESKFFSDFWTYWSGLLSVLLRVGPLWDARVDDVGNLGQNQQLQNTETFYVQSAPLQPIIHGFISREEATYMLSNDHCPVGTFVIRFSNEVGCMAITYIKRHRKGQNGRTVSDIVSVLVKPCRAHPHGWECGNSFSGSITDMKGGAGHAGRYENLSELILETDELKYLFPGLDKEKMFAPSLSRSKSMRSRPPRNARDLSSSKSIG